MTKLRNCASSPLNLTVVGQCATKDTISSPSLILKFTSYLAAALLVGSSLSSIAFAQLAGTPPIQEAEQIKPKDLSEFEDLPAALQSDKWDKLLDVFPELATGDNPTLSDGEETLTLGELVIISRAWNCLKGMIRNGLVPNLAMVELSGEMGNDNIYKSLLEAKGPMSAKQTLEFTGDALATALKYSGDANAASPLEQLTPLMTHTELEDLRLLLKNGADVNAQDVNGRTALFYQHKIKNLELLLKNGADVSILDKNGHSAMDYWKNEEERQKLLAKHGAKSTRPLDLIQITSFDGYTIAMNDLDNYAYLIISEGENAEGEAQIVYYFAQRFPRVQVKQTQDWTVFLDWLKNLPAEAPIHRYVRCQDTFALPEEWTQLHDMDEVIAKLQLREGEERSYCVCGSLEHGHGANR